MVRPWAWAISPHVERGVGELGGERLGEQGERLIFALELSTIGEDLALNLNRAVCEEGLVATAIAQGRGGGESEIEFTGETGVAFTDRKDVATVGPDGDGERGVGGLGRVDDGDAGVAGEGFAELRAHKGAGLREERLVRDGLDEERLKREFAVRSGAELVVGAGGSDEKAGKGGEEEKTRTAGGHGVWMLRCAQINKPKLRADHPRRRGANQKNQKRFFLGASPSLPSGEPFLPEALASTAARRSLARAAMGDSG